jgi:hypothetical protein
MQNQSLLNKFYEDSSIVPTAENSEGSDSITTLIATLTVGIVALISLAVAIRRYFETVITVLNQIAVLLRLCISFLPNIGRQTAPSVAIASAPPATIEIRTPTNASDDTRQFIRQTRYQLPRETRI